MTRSRLSEAQYYVVSGDTPRYEPGPGCAHVPPFLVVPVINVIFHDIRDGSHFVAIDDDTQIRYLVIGTYLHLSNAIEAAKELEREYREARKQ